MRLTTRFEAIQLTASEWVIHDHRYSADDPRHLVARLWQADPGELEATPMRDIPLARWYDSIEAVLQDIHAFIPTNTKPVPIPHIPPPRAATPVAA